jgi:hypothetical protein
MSGNFGFDKRAHERLVDDSMRDAGKDAQAAFDRVHRSYAGKPVPIVFAQLRSATRGLPLDLSDKALREYAQTISNGTRIVFDVRKAKL